MDNGEIIQLGNIFPDTEGFKNRTAGRVYSAEGLAPTVRTPSGGGIIPQIIIEDMTDTTICLNSKVDGKQPSVADRIYSTDGCSVAITSGWKQNIAEPIICAMRGRNPDGISYAVTNGEKDGMPKIQQQCDSEDVFITEIKCIDYVAPNMSSGTGYSQYFKIEIKYSNDTTQQMNLHTWYTPIETIISDFLSGLNYCPDMKHQKAYVLLLFIALSEKDSAIWELYKKFVEHNKEGWIIS